MFKSTKREYNYLSNFYPDTKFYDAEIPCNPFYEDGIEFRTVEYYYQYKKTIYISALYTEFAEELTTYANTLLKLETSLLVKTKSSKKSMSDYLWTIIKSAKKSIKRKDMEAELSKYAGEFIKNESENTMIKAIQYKFDSDINPELATQLKSITGFIGEINGRQPNRWSIGGENLLGKIISQVRDTSAKN